MDEIFDVQERLNVRNDIESFIEKYPKIRVVVTSRYESYSEVRLSEKVFGIYSLLDFSDKQVEEYVQRWYAIEAPGNQKQKNEIEDCLKQLQGVDAELRCNPLLLSLILLLYRNSLEIPTSKLSIYEGCTETLIEKRDMKEKKLEMKLKVSNRAAAFASLAFWQFTNELKNKSLPNYEQIKNHVKNYLLDKREFVEPNEAKEAAEEFLQFAQLRSIYFENKFTHKTFLEYFTASYIYNFFFTKGKPEFKKIFADGIGLSSWSVVLELLTCMIDSNQMDFDAIDELVESQIKENKVDAIILFIHVLKYLNNISPAKRKFVIEQAFHLCFSSAEKTRESKNYKQIIFSELAGLMVLDPQKKLITGAFSYAISSKAVNKRDLNVFACELALVTGDVALMEVLAKEQMEAEDEYLFILKHCPTFYKGKTYLEALRHFIKKYPKDSLVKVYTSKYDQKLFFNSSTFNWINSYIAHYLQDSDMSQLYIDLIESGVERELLINCIRKNKLEIDLDYLKSKLESTEKSKYPGLNGFIAAIREKHFKPSEKGGKKPFYDNLFVDVKKRR